MTVPRNSNPEIGLAGAEEQLQVYAAALVRERAGYLDKHTRAVEDGDDAAARRYGRRVREVDAELNRVGYDGDRGGDLPDTAADTTPVERATPAKPRGAR